MGGLTDSIWADPGFQSNSTITKSTSKRAVVKSVVPKANILDVAAREAFAKGVASVTKQNAPSKEKEKDLDKDPTTTTITKQHESIPPTMPIDAVSSLFTSLKISSDSSPVSKKIIAPTTTSTSIEQADEIPEIFVVDHDENTKPPPASESSSAPTAPSVKRAVVRLVPIKKIVATDQPVQPKPTVANVAAPSTTGLSMGATQQKKKEESSDTTTMLFQGRSKQSAEPVAPGKTAFTFTAPTNAVPSLVASAKVAPISTAPTISAPAKAAPANTAPIKPVPVKAPHIKPVPDSATSAAKASTNVAAAASKVASTTTASTGPAPVPVPKVTREGFNEDGLPLLFRGKAAMNPELMAFNESLTKGGDGRKKFAPRSNSSFVNKMENHPITRSMAVPPAGSRSPMQSTKQFAAQPMKQGPVPPAKQLGAQPVKQTVSQPVKQAAAQPGTQVSPDVAANAEKPLKLVSNSKHFKPSAEYYQEKGELKQLSVLRGKELQLEQQLASTRKQKAELTKRLAKQAAKDASL